MIYLHIISKFGYPILIRKKLYLKNSFWLNFDRISNNSDIRFEFFNLSLFTSNIGYFRSLIWIFLMLDSNIQIASDWIRFRIRHFLDIEYSIHMLVSAQMYDFAHPNIRARLTQLCTHKDRAQKLVCGRLTRSTKKNLYLPNSSLKIPIWTSKVKSNT